MKSLLRQLFDAVDNRVVMIHDPKRADRKALHTLIENQHGVSIPKFQAIMLQDGRQGCALSHKRVAEAFSNTGHHSSMPYLVFEDDILPTIDALSNTQAYADLLQCINSSDFDVLYLGGLPLPLHTSTKYSSIRAGACIQTHAMLVFPKAAQWLAEHKYKGSPIDADLLYAAWKGEIKAGFLHPALFEQSNSKSDIRRSTISQTEWFGTLFTNVVSPIWRHAVVNETLYAFLVLLFIVCLLKFKSFKS